jgi:hypothetical protein
MEGDEKLMDTFDSLLPYIFCAVPVLILLIAGGIVFGLVTGKLKPGRGKRNDFDGDIGSGL